MTGQFENHYFASPWLQFVTRNPMIYPRITQTEPIPGAVNVFIDGSKGVGVVYVEGNQPQVHVFPYKSAQAVELCAVLQLFQEVEEAFNLVSDSQYVVRVVQRLETMGVIKAASTVCTLLSSLQKMLWERKHPFCIVHVRAHSGLPGPIARGNYVADECTHFLFVFMTASPVQLASDFRRNFHVTEGTLKQKFRIT
jgi:ribonuclease HI